MLYAPGGVFVCKKMLETHDSQGRTAVPKSERSLGEMIYSAGLSASQKRYSI
jgi:hypothetical protein